MSVPPATVPPATVPQVIVAFHEDALGEWVAELACGHMQHVRHNPPLADRPWVLTTEGRQTFLGHELPCKQCVESGAERAG